MKHLFFLCAAGGGSSLIKHVISRCNNVVSFEKEGDKVWDENFGPGRLIAERKKPSPLLMEFLTDGKYYNWGYIQHRWNLLWKKQEDDRIYMQKSPDDFGRWQMLAEYFPNTHFIIMPRNPFAHCEGIIRKSNYPLSGAEAAQAWLNVFSCQIDCLENYENSTMFTFEQLCFGDEIVKDKIKELMPPDLQDVELDVEFKHNHRDNSSPSYRGIGYNVGSVNRLNQEQIYEIKKTLRPWNDTLKVAGYEV